jgi:hypothetical protein
MGTGSRWNWKIIQLLYRIDILGHCTVRADGWPTHTRLCIARKMLAGQLATTVQGRPQPVLHDHNHLPISSHYCVLGDPVPSTVHLHSNGGSMDRRMFLCRTTSLPANRQQISKHGMNSLVAAFEVLIPSTDPPPIAHVILIVIVLGLYLGWCYVTAATQGFIPYSFLDPRNGVGMMIGFIVGVLAGAIFTFFVVMGVIWVRRRIAPEGKRSKHDTSYNSRGDVEMTMDAPDTLSEMSPRIIPRK